MDRGRAEGTVLEPMKECHTPMAPTVVALKGKNGRTGGKPAEAYAEFLAEDQRGRKDECEAGAELPAWGDAPIGNRGAGMQVSEGPTTME